MSKAQKGLACVLGLLVVIGLSSSARAFPGFYVSKAGGKRTLREGHVVIMRRNNTSVVTVMPDYDGPLDAFALVLAVPGDVTLEQVRTLKREFVDRVAQISAPRFHEWWEMDPCEPGPSEQEWERSLKADPNSAFLGGGPAPNAQSNAPRELFVNVKSDYKQGEFTFWLVPPKRPLGEALRSKGYALPAGADQAAAPYAKAGMNFLVAEVDSKRIELTGSGSAQLSPIRFETNSVVETLPVRLGLLSADGMQELFVYVLDPEKRYEAKNYPNVLPPSNVQVDYVVKERMGEFYAALHDRLLKKNPEGILNEYAWHTSGCGEPCPNAPLQPSELLSLGGDVFEASLPKEVQEPVPPPLTEEEQRAQTAALESVPPKDWAARRKQWANERRVVLRNRGILERQRYMLSRLHHRYDRSSLPNDLEITPAIPKRGGIGTPQGPKADLSLDFVEASESRLQMRYTFFHPWQGPQKCQSPERWRWGKAPRSYRGLRKTWIAEGLARRNRTQIKLENVIQTPLPAFGIPGHDEASADAGSETAAPDARKSGTCGCSLPGRPVRSAALLALACGLIARWLRRARGSVR